MTAKRTIHIAVLKEHLSENDIMDALTSVGNCTGSTLDGIIHVSVIVDEARSNHIDKDCALTADIIAELATEEKIMDILDGLGCCYALMPEEIISMGPESIARTGELSNLLRDIHHLDCTSRSLISFIKSQDTGFAMRRLLSYPVKTLFHALSSADGALNTATPLVLDDYYSIMHFWAYGEYKDHPLCFVDIGQPTPEQIVRILSQYDEWYGNTDQDTEVYALEFQILTRMLLSAGKLLLNPKYLDVTEPDVIEWQDAMLAEIGAPVTKDGLTAFAISRRLRQSEINVLYKYSNDASMHPSRGNCFVYGGYHFVPLQQTINKNSEELLRQVASDPSLGFSTYSWCRFPYCYKDFYKAAGTVDASNCDLFRCIENGRVYIPGLNELFIYRGKVDDSSI